jgi:hypothetical protein
MTRLPLALAALLALGCAVDEGPLDVEGLGDDLGDDLGDEVGETGSSESESTSDGDVAPGDGDTSDGDGDPGDGDPGVEGWCCDCATLAGPLWDCFVTTAVACAPLNGWVWCVDGAPLDCVDACA